MMLTTQAWIALAVTAAVFLILQLRKRTSVDLLFLIAMVVVTVSGIITPEQAIAGFSKPAVITIGALLVVASALRETGVLDWLGQKLLGSAKDEKSAFVRLAVTLVTTSAFLLNTALVVMMVPVVLDWCRKRHISPSRLMIPVSYLTILGGVCSMIGTSTTLIVNTELKTHAQIARDELLAKEPSLTPEQFQQQQAFVDQLRPMSLFEIGRAGLPCALVGTLVLAFVGRRILPDRIEMIEKLGDARREYLVEMLVQPECRLIGQTVEHAGLRQLPGLYLIEIDRDGDIITPVTPDDVIRAGDRLVFTGVVTTIVDLEKIPGLVPAADLTYEFPFKQTHRRHLSEAVLSRTSPLIGRTVREANFRRRYNAAVVAVHRGGQRVTSKIGDIALEPGDTLLLQTRDDFVTRYRNDPTFYLVSGVEGYSPRRHDRALVAGSLLILLIGWLIVANFDFAKNISPMFASPALPAVASVAVAVAMIMTRCISTADARSALNLQVLITIVGALALGQALQSSGAADGIAKFIVHRVGHEHPFLLLLVVYGLAMVFTELITNNAVAVIVLPLAISVAQNAGLNPRPFVMAVAMSASLAFLTPVGYQTNLMVMGPGGYRPSDFLKVGLPISLSVTITAVVLIPMIWPF
ncbi:MAG: SLC13 family permease [Planctomycetales bacterium]|nr:SLC13 family permease [Planctomycetales bacterium]